MSRLRISLVISLLFISWILGAQEKGFGLGVIVGEPTGISVKAWMGKAHIQGYRGSTVVCLVPARTDTAWWHDYAMEGDIEFLRGRLKFGGHKNNAPFPSAIVVFNIDRGVYVR